MSNIEEYYEAATDGGVKSRQSTMKFNNKRTQYMMDEDDEGGYGIGHSEIQ